MSHPCSMFRCTCRGFKQQKWAPNKCSACFHWLENHSPASQPGSPIRSDTSHNNNTHDHRPAHSRASSGNSACSSPLSSPHLMASVPPLAFSPLSSHDRKSPFVSALSSAPASVPSSPPASSPSSPSPSPSSSFSSSSSLASSSSSGLSSPPRSRSSSASSICPSPYSSTATPLLSPFVFNFDGSSASPLPPRNSSIPPPPKRPAPSRTPGPPPPPPPQHLSSLRQDETVASRDSHVSDSSDMSKYQWKSRQSGNSSASNTSNDEKCDNNNSPNLKNNNNTNDDKINNYAASNKLNYARSPSPSDDESSSVPSTPTSFSLFSSALALTLNNSNAMRAFPPPSHSRYSSVSSIASFKSDCSAVVHDEVPLPVVGSGNMAFAQENCSEPSTPQNAFLSALDTPKTPRTPHSRMSKGMQESRSVLARLLRQAKAPPLPPLPSLHEFNHAMLSMLALRLPPPEPPVDPFDEDSPKLRAPETWLLTCRHCTLENVVRSDQQALSLCQACSHPLEDSDDDELETSEGPSTGDEPHSGIDDDSDLVSSDGSGNANSRRGSVASGRGSVASGRGSVINGRSRTGSVASYASEQASTKSRHRTASNASSVFGYADSLASPAARPRSSSGRLRSRSMEVSVSTVDEIVSDISSLPFMTRQPFFDPFIRRENYLLHLNDSFNASLTCVILPGMPELAGVWAESMLGVEYRYASMRSYFETFRANDWGLTVLNPHFGGVDLNGERYLTQLMQVLAQISDSSHIVLLGFSMGGKALLHFLSDVSFDQKYAPRIKGLILLDAVAARSQTWIDTIKKFKPKTLIATSSDFGTAPTFIAGVEHCDFICPHGRLPTKALSKVTSFFGDLSSALIEVED